MLFAFVVQLLFPYYIGLHRTKLLVSCIDVTTDMAYCSLYMAYDQVNFTPAKVILSE